VRHLTRFVHLYRVKTEIKSKHESKIISAPSTDSCSSRCFIWKFSVQGWMKPAWAGRFVEKPAKPFPADFFPWISEAKKMTSASPWWTSCPPPRNDSLNRRTTLPPIISRCVGISLKRIGVSRKAATSSTSRATATSPGPERWPPTHTWPTSRCWPPGSGKALTVSNS